jgi:GntR family transcriptional regulator/MocR family aminotransferase
MILTLDGHGPRYAQISRALVALIRHGALAPGTRVPSSRELARDVGCSRNVVLLAYEQLLLEGYFVGRERAGTFVAPELTRIDDNSREGRGSSPSPRVKPRVRLTRAGRRLTRAAAVAMMPIQHQPACAIDFMYGLSEPDERFLRRLRAALGAALRERAFFPGPAQGDLALREEIAQRLTAARGITRSAAHIVITSGTQQAINLCCRLLLDPGDGVIVEDPGYDFVRAAFLAADARITYARVDRDGLNPADLPSRKPARLVYVTPSHQFPTGVVTPASRRHALVTWARRNGAFIFEDDYDGEFRYAGQPIPALASLDPDVVIYCGTFSKSLFPTWRLGYLVLPPALVQPVAQCKWITDLASSRLTQRALPHLLANGEFDRHVRRMQRRYRERRDALVRTLRRHFKDDAEIEGASAGLHLTIRLRRLGLNGVDDLIERCRARGVGVYSLARHAKQRLGCATLILGYGLVDVRQIERGIRVVAEESR